MYHQMRLTLDLISNELENAVFYDFTSSYPEKTAFEGEEDLITFLLATGKGLKVVRYYLASPEGGRVHKVMVGARHARNVDTTVDYREQEMSLRDLVREEWDFPEYLSGVIAQDHAAEVIATNIRENSLEFSYGYADEQSGQADHAYEWRRAWTEKSLPFLVRLKMDFMITGPAPRVVTMSKDVLIPQGFWGKQQGT